MDIYGEKVNRLIGELGRLPGIGGKTAQRLAFHIINMPEEQVESLSAAITDAKKNIRYCKSCYTITDQELCPVCASPKRNHKLIMVVETPRDLAAYERVGQYQGVYHVLNGVINPAMGIGTGDIRLKELILRLEQEDVVDYCNKFQCGGRSDCDVYIQASQAIWNQGHKNCKWRSGRRRSGMY